MTNSVVVNLFPQPSVTATSTNVLCFGAANGTATALATGGTPAYSYLWTPTNQTTATATGLAPGVYNVNITDANGCTGNAAVSFAENMGNAPSTISIAAHESANVSKTWP